MGTYIQTQETHQDTGHTYRHGACILLEPVRAGSLGPNWAKAQIVGLWLQLMCCTRSAIQPWDFGNRYRPKAEIT
jgi:hypothetical protein